MKIALIYDDLHQRGGGEGLFFNLVSIFPKASIFVPIISNDHLKSLVKRKVFKSTFLSFLANKGEFLYKISSFFSLFWFENLYLGEYDLVISLSNRFAHCVITTPQTKHISIVTSPIREVWETPLNNSDSTGSLFFKITKNLLRTYNFYSARRPDLVVPISQFVAKKIDKSWRIDKKNVFTLYPPLQPISFTTPNHSRKKFSNYILLVSRLNKWKYPYIKQALEELKNTNLKIKHVGSGPLLKCARQDFKKYKNIEFLGRVSDKKLGSLYSNAHVFLHPQLEDFGLTPLEAISFGVPVVAYRSGGVLEYLNSKVALFYSKTSEIPFIINSIPNNFIDIKEAKKILELHTLEKFRYNLLQLIKTVK
ncbi:glycosyltransferase family 4 protein [bacterium]|nr:glycosyltransferase family 4 protein [bacterium]